MSDVQLQSRRGANEGGSLVTRAIDAVTRHIRSNGLRVGDTLPGEAHFAEELGVSRAVMREAFGALAALRLIDVGNGRTARQRRRWVGVCGVARPCSSPPLEITVPDVAGDVRRTIEVRTVPSPPKSAPRLKPNASWRSRKPWPMMWPIARRLRTTTSTFMKPSRAPATARPVRADRRLLRSPDAGRGARRLGHAHHRQTKGVDHRQSPGARPRYC